MPELSTTRLLRVMAWERAKGELESIIQTYYGEEDKFERFDALKHQFTKTVEDEGLVE